ncbi:hypothetical protein [Luteimonas suaedae]|uniref:hypothetical protein n=1 Tax=Luteimonas suaedae TaxID=2605430 RepID=UPI0011EE12EA|nr:hypothetical protein [Luteimonas suaedae]
MKRSLPRIEAGDTGGVDRSIRRRAKASQGMHRGILQSAGVRGLGCMNTGTDPADRRVASIVGSRGTAAWKRFHYAVIGAGSQVARRPCVCAPMTAQ